MDVAKTFFLVREGKLASFSRVAFGAKRDGCSQVQLQKRPQTRFLVNTIIYLVLVVIGVGGGWRAKSSWEFKTLPSFRVFQSSIYRKTEAFLVENLMNQVLAFFLLA